MPVNPVPRIEDQPLNNFAQSVQRTLAVEWATTAGRPDAKLNWRGRNLYDFTLRKPVWWDDTIIVGGAWVDSTGAIV